MRVFARLPLWLFHAVGVLLGWLVYLADAGYARRLRENLQASGVASSLTAYRRLLFRSIVASGKGVLEVLVIWFRSDAAVCKLVKRVQGWEYVEAAQAAAKGVIILTPHLGCFEIAGCYCGAHFPSPNSIAHPSLLG